MLTGFHNCWNTSLSNTLDWKTLGIVKITCSLNFFVKSNILTLSVIDFLTSFAKLNDSVIPTVSSGTVLVFPIPFANVSVIPIVSVTDFFI